MKNILFRVSVRDLKRAGLCAVLGLACLALAPAAAAGRCDELWAAAMADDMSGVAKLINAGENVNCRDPVTAQTPLMAAAQLTLRTRNATLK